jgi:Ca-activated chloride channel family protein
MTKQASSRFVLLLGMTCLGCAGSAGSMGATPGGAQDNGLAQTQIASGQVPRPEAFTVEGLLNQYDLPLESQTCNQDLCVDAAYGVAPGLVQTRSAVFVQIGFSSGIDPTTFHRQPLNLVVLVDRSGSMGGDKINSVKQALGRLIDQLGPSDRLGIVLFDDRVDILVAPALVTNPAALKSTVAGIAVRGATNMAAGLRSATSLVTANAGQAGVSDRIMVFTDANTNTGDVDQTTFVSLATSNAAANIGLTLFGVGTDLNQDLVLAITGVRGANYFFLANATEIATVFDVDFDYLVTPLAYDLQFQLLPATGFVITAVYGFPSWRAGSAAVQMTIPTVFLSRNHGALVVRLEPSASVWPSGQCPLAALSLTYTPVGGGPAVSQSLSSVYAGTTPLADDTIYFSERAVRKSVDLVNEALAEAQASSYYYGGGSTTAAINLLETTRAMLQAEATALEDADLRTEATNVSILETNMRNGAYTYNNTSEEMPRACSFGGGQSAGASLAPVGLALLALLGLRRRARRS